MPLGKKLSRRLKKTFSFKSRGNYDLTPKVDPSRPRKHKDSDRSSSESEGIFRQPSTDPVGLAGSGLGIGSVYSLQQSPHLRKASRNHRPSVGSLNDLPGTDNQLPTPSPLTADAKPKFVFTRKGGTITALDINKEEEKSTKKEIQHFVKGVHFPETGQHEYGQENNVNHVNIEHNLIYQGVAFKPEPGKKPGKEEHVTALLNEDDLDDPDYSTIPGPSSAFPGTHCAGHDVLSSQGIDLDLENPSCIVESEVPLAVQDSHKLPNYDDDDPGYSTVPQLREDLKLVPLDTSLPIKSDDPGYETLDEAKKKLELLQRKSSEGNNGQSLRSPESNLPELLYDNAAFCNASYKLPESTGIYDNVNLPTLSGENFSNSSTSPEGKREGSAVGVNVLSSQDSGIDTTGPSSPKVTSPPLLVKRSTANKQTHNVDPSVSKHSDNTSDISFAHTRSQSIGVSTEPSHTHVEEEDLYSTVGNKSRSSIEISSIVENTSEPAIMDSDDIAPPVPTRNYLRYMSTEESNQGTERSQTVEAGLDREGNITHVVGSDTGEQSKPSTSLGTELTSATAGKTKSQNVQESGATDKQTLSSLDGITSENQVKNDVAREGNVEQSKSNLMSEDELTLRVAEMTVVERAEGKRLSGEQSQSPSSQSRGSKRDSSNGNSLEATGAPAPHSPGGSSEFSQVDFINSLKELKESGWYWGPLSASEAEAKLGGKPDGSFLVRDSSDERYILSISFNSQGATHHTRIEHYKGYFSFYSQPSSHGYGTIVEFIQRVMEHSRNGSFSYFLRPSAPGNPPMQVSWS